MKVKLGNSIAILLIATILLSVMPVFAGYPNVPHDGNAMWIECQDSLSPNLDSVNLTTANAAHKVGFLFNLTVWVNITGGLTGNALGVDTWQAKVWFNPAILQCVAADYTTINGTTHKSQFFENYTITGGPIPAITIDNTNGFVFTGETITTAYRTPTAFGSLLWMELNVTKVPDKGSSIEDTFTLDPSASYVLDNADPNPGTVCPPTLYDATYEFLWQPPPSPHLEVSPLSPIYFGPNPPSAVGQTCNVQVYIRSLSESWGLINASFTLIFNTTLIDILQTAGVGNVTIDALWAGPNSTVVNHGTPYDSVSIFVSGPTSTPSGDVLIATIKFTVMEQQTAPPAPFGFQEISPLDLPPEDIVLWDKPDMLIPTTAPQNGSVVIIALRLLTLPQLSLQPSSVTMGPTPVVGHTFSVDVVCKDLDQFWYAIAFQFRVLYDHSFLDVVGATEGPMWQRSTGDTDEWGNSTYVDLTNPVGSRWGAHTIVAWTDRDSSGDLSVGDWLDTEDLPSTTVTHWVVTAFDPTIIPPYNTMTLDVAVNFWNQYGTFFTSLNEYDSLFDYVGDGSIWNVWAADILLPNGTGDYDLPVYPNIDSSGDVLATITFVVTKQMCPYNYTSDLNITAFMTDGDQAFVTVGGDYVSADLVNGTATVLGNYPATGRVIDVYGGAKNDGYWTGYPNPFPSPYGGQGAGSIGTNGVFQGAWMDLVFPQSEVTLYGAVTYNWWPVQSKDVGFEIEGPYIKLTNGTLVPAQTYYVLAKLVGTTDSDGIAHVTFRMPWPCDNPDSFTGIWKVTATATVADVEIKDVTIFYYQRPVYITKVTTDAYSYLHGDTVTITIAYQTHSVQTYPALFSAVLTDDLGVPVGMALIGKTVGGATFCTWKTGSVKVTIVIPKYAYAGYGYIHANVYDKDPTVGGEAYDPEYRDVPPVLYPSGHSSDLPEIQINPY
jgi:hypothetical protein